MKALTLFCILMSLLFCADGYSQFRNGNRFGNQRGSQIPQAQSPPPEPEAKTADQLVDEQMPKITENLGLDPFEEAVVRSTLVKYVQKRLELQILKLPGDKMREAFEKLSEEQNAELKAGLPPEKFEAYKEMERNRFQTKKKKKKKKKKKSQESDETDS